MKNYKTYKARRDTEDDLEVDSHLGYSERTSVSTLVSIYLDEPIKEPKYYRAVVDKVMSLQEGDQLVYSISSPGGDMQGMISLIEANNNSGADILANIVGECHSTASMFALSCPNITVSPSATMMVHHVTFGAGGKSSDVQSQVKHTAEFCDNYFKDIYEGFLTESEINLCIEHGKEIWLMSEEIIQRLHNRNEYFKNKSDGEPLVFPPIEIEEEIIEKPKKNTKNKNT